MTSRMPKYMPEPDAFKADCEPKSKKARTTYNLAKGDTETLFQIFGGQPDYEKYLVRQEKGNSRLIIGTLNGKNVELTYKNTGGNNPNGHIAHVSTADKT